MKKIITLLGVITFLITSCSSSYIKDSSNVSQLKKKYDKILVVAKTNDKVARLKFENQIVQDFASKGIAASASMSVLLTEDFSKEISEENIESLRQQLVADGYSGVVITFLIDKNQYSDVVPGSRSTTYYPVRYGRFGRYITAYPVTRWEPDQIKVGVEYTLESCLYDITVNQKDNLQWIGRFQIKDPSNLGKTIEKYSKELTDELLEQSISN